VLIQAIDTVPLSTAQRYAKKLGLNRCLQHRCGEKRGGPIFDMNASALKTLSGQENHGACSMEPLTASRPLLVRDSEPVNAAPAFTLRQKSGKQATTRNTSSECAGSGGIKKE
jgi:hypothetical protein